MGRLDSQRFACVDCETTGLDAHEDRIIEVAVIVFDFDRVHEEFESLIDPEREIPEASMEFHHISQQMVQGKPKIAEVLPEILKMLGNHIIVGHGIEFDVQLLIIAAERAGIPCTLQNNKLIDTLRMARRYGGSPVNSLEQLRQHFHIPLEGAHRAMSDVIVNKQVFQKLAFEYRTTEDIFNMLSRPIMLKIMPLGPYKGRLMKDVPLQYLHWAASKDSFDQDLSYTIRMELSRRKKGNLFSQVTNPFQGL
jgi:DNA polymerase-3 subunit epsilon